MPNEVTGFQVGDTIIPYAKPDWDQNNPSAPDYISNKPFLPIGARYNDLDWQTGVRYNINTGDIETIGGRKCLGKFTLEHDKYRIRDKSLGQLIYLDWLEFGEDGALISSLETTPNTTSIVFCPNPKHKYAININDSRNLPENIIIERIEPIGSNQISIVLNGDTSFIMGSMVYVDATSLVRSAIPTATSDTGLVNTIDRCNETLHLYTGSGSASANPGDGSPNYILAYWGGNQCQLCIRNLGSISEAIEYYTAHPTTIILNGADESYYTLNKLDRTKRISEKSELPSSATSGQVLTWNGTAWVAGDASSEIDTASVAETLDYLENNFAILPSAEGVGF